MWGLFFFSCENSRHCLNSHISIDQFDELIRSFFNKYLDRAAIILITSVIGVPEKLLRINPTMKKPEKAKLDPVVSEFF